MVNIINMKSKKEIQKEITVKEDYAVSLELDIQFTQDLIHNEGDDIHIIFLNDHLEMLKYELDSTNAELYLLRRKINNYQLIDFPIFRSRSD